MNGASLAIFRIALGIIMALEAWSLLRPNAAAISSGKTPLETYYAGPDILFNFPYEGFGWLPLLPANWMYAVVALQIIAGVMTALGFCYRYSAAAMFVTSGYFFLVESTRTYWQSHYYLEFLACFLIIWMPAARRFSIDAALGREGGERMVPFWTLLILRGQLVIAYFYAGVAKINLDWLADAVPVRWFLKEPHVLAPYEKLLPSGLFNAMESVVHNVGFAYFLSYTGLIFDCAIGFLLLARRTRIFGLVLMLIFHATNHFLIFDDISWFPLLGITTATIFLDPDWPERFWAWIRNRRWVAPDWGWFKVGGLVFPVVGMTLGWKLAPTPDQPRPAFKLNKWTPRLVAGWLIFQTFMPIRHYLITGDGRFTYEGFSFSWRLKADVHRAYGHQLFIRDSGLVNAKVVGPTAINWQDWRGEKVFYRRLTPGHINWKALPEIMVVVEPFLGERILFNPLATGIGDETGARGRLAEYWKGIYGAEPSAQRVMPLAETLNSIAVALTAGGFTEEAQKTGELAARAKGLPGMALASMESIRIVTDLRAAAKRWSEIANLPPEALTAIRALPPFALEGERPGGAPFLVVDDANLVDRAKSLPWKVNSQKWKGASIASTLLEGRPLEPMPIYMGELGEQARELLPESLFLVYAEATGRPPVIWWNSLKDINTSKFNHVSNQAFYLRRYARRVAALWEQKHGRRPVITAATSVSFNGRPAQPLVDPAADLASVPVKYFQHNPWIRDLQTPRIPPEGVINGKIF